LYASRASNTQIVVLNDDRGEPLAASQFHPVGQLFGEQSGDKAPDILAEVGTDGHELSVNARL
jgi:hypothetical protein